LEIIEIAILSLVFYLIGSIPFAFLIPKIFGFGDIRKIGSGNIGSTNVLRTGNKFLAILVLFFDISKGLIPFLYFKNLFSIYEFVNWNVETDILIYLISSFAILGHIYPLWLKFKGGKGVATYIGFLFGANYILGLIFICCWLIIALLSKYSSLSSILSLIIIPFLNLYLFSFNSSSNYLFFVISLIIVIKHYSNILRLFNKTENKISF